MSGIHLLYAKGFHLQLERLVKSDRKGKMAAERCEEILEIIRGEGLYNRNLLHKRTKRGEYRLKNCYKYALGSGYRLITVCRDEVLYVCFIGTHDDANKWLKQNRFENFTRTSFAACRDECCHSDSRSEECEQEIEVSILIDEYEEKLRTRLTDDILRSVFSGLAR